MKSPCALVQGLFLCLQGHENNKPRRGKDCFRDEAFFFFYSVYRVVWLVKRVYDSLPI
jgi:hypothetical protein